DGDIPHPTHLSIPLVVSGTWDQHVARHPHRRDLPFADLGRWSANIAGHGRSRFSVVADVWREDQSLGQEQGNWCYPIFSLGATIDPTTETGFLIRARVAAPAQT